MKTRRILFGSLILGVACFWWLYFRPSRVWVQFSNLPPGTCFTSVVAERNGVLHNLNWYYMTELLVPMTSHPGHDVGSELPGAQIYAWDLETLVLQLLGGPDPGYPVEWGSGDRFGVVTKTRDGVWDITWFSPEQAAPHRALRHFGGKAVALDLTEGVRERMDAVQVDELLDKHLGLLFEKLPGPTSTEWGGRLEDMELEKERPTEGFVTNKEDFARLWKAWMGKEAVPEIDFDRQLVLVGTSSKGRIWGLKLIDDKGDARWVAKLGTTPVKGFTFAIAVFQRGDIKTINGKPIEK